MNTLSWTTLDKIAAPSVVVMASYFRLRRYRDIPRFLGDSLRIRRQIRSARGAFGVGLQAHPFRREFLTLSAWSDRGAVRDLVRAEPHASAMQRHRAAMSESSFVFYDTCGTDFPPSWTEARSRLDRQRVSE